MVNTGKFRIMIVTDDEMFRFKLMDVLQYEGNLEITGDFDTAETALEKLESANPDIIILSAELSGMNGFDACHRFLEQNSGCDIIMFGANRNNDQKAMEAGAGWYFPVYMEPSSLASVIRMTAKWRCMKSGMGKRCSSFDELASMLAEHLNDTVSDNTDKTADAKLTEAPCGENKEVKINIAVPHTITQLTGFLRQLEETLHYGIEETTGSAEGTRIRLEIREEFSSPAIMETLSRMPEVGNTREDSKTGEILLTLRDRPVLPVAEEKPVLTKIIGAEKREMAGITAG